MIQVLSPHRDDAIFSLFFTLSAAVENGTAVLVRNFFTVSAYAPEIGPTAEDLISQVRKREDLAALRRMGRSIRVVDCDLLDAPIRLGIPAREVCYTRQRECDVQLVAKQIPSGPAELTFAPLGLGGHVDHLTVKDAAMRSISRKRIAFYEDLPYAMWSHHQIPAVIGEIEEKLQTRLSARIVRGNRSFLEKRSACARYRSQIKAAEADAMARWSHRYGTAERIWIPKGTNWD